MRFVTFLLLLLATPCYAQSTLADADAAYKVRKYETALELYRKARDTESRSDERQRATAMIVRSLRALERSSESYQEFFTLCRVAPFSTHFDCIPLVWFTSRTFTPVAVTPDERLALDWLSPKTNPSGVDNPAASLLAASILLSSTQATNRSKAVERLEQLTFPGNVTDREGAVRQKISLLAQMQLRRVQIAALKEESELALWESTLEKLPDSLQGGPYYVLGLAYAKLQNDEQAILCWMRVPILFPEDRSLSAQSLQEAAKALRRLGRNEEEQTLLNELRRDYSPP
ncbi:MAG: hypothetical protein FWC43_11075 [Planctomycetaceae bacterium]|nr:hypothetical protein [Planctomycetaceae bacterium]